MFARSIVASIPIAFVAGMAWAQTPASTRPTNAPTASASTASAVPASATPVTSSGTQSGWRVPGSAKKKAAASATDKAVKPASVSEPVPPLRPVSGATRTPLARVTKGPNTLPNDAGQEWRDYDISPYTARVTSTNRPEQAIVDWILRETGYEAWHGEPLGMLSADHRTLRVYHTPAMHAVISDMVDRFVNSEADSHAFGMRVVTVGSPNWRAKSYRMLKPVTTKSQGVQAWLLAKEDAALLMADLRKRSDFREHSTPHLLINNGQANVISATQSRNYVRNVIFRNDAWPGFEPEVTQLNEGFSLEFSPLLSLDGRTIDAVIKCNIDQVEKMIPVMIDVPTPVAPRQRTKIEVPQLTSCHLHERFRWPTDHVLLISLGVVATPTPPIANSLTSSLPLIGTPTRADLLVFVESRGNVAATTPGQAPPRTANTFQGRY